ncbi:MAG: DUF4124 domain-containing protein [Stenotrophomonas sp.]
MNSWLLGGLLLASLPLAAAEIVFYRCTDAQGALTVQNMPCPKGMQQTKKVMQAAAPPVRAALPIAPPVPAVEPLMAARVAAVPAAVPAAPKAKPATNPQPLPPLFQCKGADEETYFSEDEQAPSRCVTMRVTGLDGNPMTGAGEACEVIRDRCSAVTAEQACAVWRQRVEEAETHWRFASPGHAETRQREYQRLRELFDGSRCAGEG